MVFRKVLYVVLSLILILSFVGCNKEDKPSMTDEEMVRAKRLIANASKDSSTWIEFINDELNISDGYGVITGSVENISNGTVFSFTIVCKFLDENGKVLDSTSILILEDLKYGDQKNFEIKHKWDEAYESYKLSATDVSSNN